MTTRVHVVNFGPEPVEVQPTYILDGVLRQAQVPVKLYFQQSTDMYVYDGHDVVIKEVKES